MSTKKSKEKVPLGERIRNYFLGEDTWENIKSIGWTASIFGWIIAFNYIGVWSLAIPICFGIIQRELNMNRKDTIHTYSKYNYAKMRVWEDKTYNYEASLVFKNTEVYPLELKPNIKGKVFYYSKKTRSELLKQLEKKNSKIIDITNTIEKMEKDLEKEEKEKKDKKEKEEKEKKDKEQKESKKDEEENEEEDEEDEEDEHIDEAEVKIKEEKIKEEKPKQKTRAENLSIQIKELETQLQKIEEEEIVDTDEKQIKITTKMFELINDTFKRYKPFLIIKEWSNSIKEPKVILLCPDDFWSCFSFPAKPSMFKSFLVPYARRADFSVYDMGTYKDCKLYRVTECNYNISKMNIDDVKPELFEMDHIDAEILYTARESGKVLEDIQTLSLDNMVLNGQVKALEDNNKLTAKKYELSIIENRKIEENIKKVNPTFGAPPKNLYLITYAGWILALILLIKMLVG